MTEFDLIARLTAGIPERGEGLLQGIGDDGAVIAGPGGEAWIVTTDALLEDVHFRRAWGTFEQLGRKAFSVNASDIAAMGGESAFLLLSLGIPDDLDAEAAQRFVAGLRAAAEEARVVLIGGDTVRSRSGLALGIVAIGRVPREKVVTRGGARPGDALFVTGTLGGAAIGLAALERGMGEAFAPFTQRLLDPRPPLACGPRLAASGAVSAMIDISDGLVADLGHIADRSGVGFELRADRLPAAPGLAQAAAALERDPLSCMLGGGEEYELLFAVAADRCAAFEADLLPALDRPAVRIGTIVEAGEGRHIIDAEGGTVEPPVAGFDHFA